MEIIRKRLLQRDAFRLCTFCNFIAGGVQNDAGMIKVLFHHIFQILLPPVCHIRGIVMLGLVHIPAINVLVHHQHTKSVTGIEQIFGCRIVSRSDCVIPCFLQNADTALLYFGIGACTENPVIVVNAGAAQNNTLTVDSHTLVRGPCQGADTEVLLYHIVSKGNTDGIKVRRFGRPELCIRDSEFRYGVPGRVRLKSNGSYTFRSVQYFKRDGTGKRRFNPDPDLCRGNAQRFYPYTV